MQPVTRRTVTAAAAAALLLTAACSNNSNEDPDPDSPLEIRFAWWGSGERNELTQGVIDLFEEANPDVVVSGEPSEFNAHWERLTVQGASGGAPCVPQQQSRFVADYATRNQLVDLGPLIEDGSIDVSGIPELVLGAGELNGTHYMVPYGSFYYTGFYNRTLVEEYSLVEPTADWDWAEWEQWLYDARAALPDDMYVIDLAAAQDLTGLFQNWMVSNGDSIYGDGELGFSEETLVEWFELWQGFIEDGISTTPQMLGERGVTIEENPLALGQTIWWPTPDNQLSQFNAASAGSGVGEIWMDKLPNGPSGSGEVLGASGLSISTSCDGDAATAAAARFIDFWINDPDAAALFASNNGTVTVTEFQETQLQDSEESPYVQRQIELARQVIDEFDPTAEVTPVGGRLPSDAFTRFAQAVWLGEQTPESAAAGFFAESNASLAAGQ